MIISMDEFNPNIELSMENCIGTSPRWACPTGVWKLRGTFPWGACTMPVHISGMLAKSPKIMSEVGVV